DHRSGHRLSDVRLRRHLPLGRADGGHLAEHDLARRVRPRRGRADPAAARPARHPGDVLRAGAHRRDLPRCRPGDRRRRARGRPPRLPAREPGRVGLRGGRAAGARAGAGRARAYRRCPPGRLPLAVVGQQPAHGRAAARARLPLRELVDGARLRALLVPGRGRDPGRRPLPVRPRGRPRRDARELGPRRLPPLRVPARRQPRQPGAVGAVEGRGDLARRVRLHAPRGAGRGLHADDAPPGDRPRTPDADAGAPDRPLRRGRRRPLHDPGRRGGGVPRRAAVTAVRAADL
ncbi:MAG: hypothetical protein AVDCRST_MAG49-37, partial [uncultured Thermomicrobiales bacterium]